MKNLVVTYVQAGSLYVILLAQLYITRHKNEYACTGIDAKKNYLKTMKIGASPQTLFLRRKIYLEG